MSASATSREDARQLVQSIAENNGYVREDDWNSMSLAVRERVRNAMRNLEGIAGVAVTTLAKNLYTSDARFVFELLQNSEDNSFDKAREEGLTPYVSFDVHPDHIIIDCNEDGFEPENLRAICAVGQSSKTGVHKGYVGEKGIGFKSVFMAAWKVHIQSNNFSFFFQHKRGDQGLGMISPIWHETDQTLSPPKTRMKLLLGDGYKPIPSSQYQNILDQFDKLNENILLFMRNLEEIRISIFDKTGKAERCTIFSKKRIYSNRIRLTKLTETGKKEQDYYIVKHTVGNLEKNENRTYSEYEENNKAYSSAEVALGFPLTADSVPIIDYQDIFAYLPVKKAGFRFLINSDFVTQANRQDIVTTSGRNIGIRRGIADAFIHAINELCGHDKLQYTWMRFLPDRTEHQYDPFWSQLVSLLEDKLKVTPVLRPRSEKPLRLISDLRFLLTSQCQLSGAPLFGDVYPEKYLSKHYGEKDIQILRNYGLSECTAGEIVSAVQLDLASLTSVMRSAMPDDWHTRSSGYLSSIYYLRGELSNIPLIPLSNGSWVSGSYGSGPPRSGLDGPGIYFPKTNDLEIPPGLVLNIIDLKAYKNVQRRKLFSKLGAQVACVPLVRNQIFDAQFKVFNDTSSVPDIPSLVKQLQYLFSTDGYKASSEDKMKITIVNTENLKLLPHITDVYMRDNSPFGPSELLKEAKITDGLSVNFLHSSYMNNIFEGDDNLINSWKNWLCKYAVIRRHLRIISKDNKNKLSKECQYVAIHRTDKFLRFLRYTWDQEGLDIKADGNLSKELRNIKVPTQSGQMEILGKTYIPLPNLIQQWNRYSMPTENFPFLNLDEEITRDTYANHWGFLVSSLSVRAEDDVYFYMDILLHVMATYNGEDIDDASRLFDLYNVIYGKCLQSPADGDKIREYFHSEKLIYVPKNKYSAYHRMSPRDCVWDGPRILSSKASLKARYEATRISQRKNFSSIIEFFTNTLGIGNCDEKVIYTELIGLKDSGSHDFERIYTLYNSLWQILSKKNTSKAKALMKDKFVDEALIYTPSDNCWNKISDCLWSSATTIRGKRVLENNYKELKKFFVDILGVATLNLQLIYEELLKLGKSTPTVESVKEQLFAFNGHLHSIKDYKDITPSQLKGANIFPVRAPGNQRNILFCNGKEDFAIANRIHWENNLRPLIKTLDFTLNEIHELEPFIRWIGFEERYLSLIVRETSEVGDSTLVPSLSLSRDIKQKAHALCRVAKHYRSPRSHDPESLNNLYKMLKQVKVFETEKISCVLHVPQDGKDYSYEMSRSEIHIQETNSNLEIFVPRDERNRARCLSHALPARLFQWLITGPLAQIKSGTNGQSYLVVKEILREDPGMISEVLDKDGIASVHMESVEFSDDEVSVSTKSARGEASGITNSTGFDSNSAPHTTDNSSSTIGFQQDEASTTVVHEVVVSASSRFDAPQRINRPYTQVEPLDASTHKLSVSATLQRETTSADLRYSDLLSQVVSAARNGSFPTKNIFDLSALRTSLPFFSDSDANDHDNDDYELSYARGFPPLERDKMVGAAGELYVFELLKACNPSLPNFGVDNWKSTIRSYARKHPEYATMEPWRGFETSDLVYNDTMGVFTNLLIDSCYLDASIWKDRRPTYYFEVKTTTASRETRFFISKKQYKMLHDNRGKENSIYVIFRVFNLGKSNFGLRIYVDPAELEAKQELLFTPETWSVIPRA